MKTFSATLGVALIFVQPVIAQFYEDFSDGELETAPAWSGSLTSFTINADTALQLSASAAGSAWLASAVPFLPGRQVVWEFAIRQAFSPSGANYGRVYLMADQQNLFSPLNGYYLQFGQAGGDDAVALFRQSGTERVEVCRGTAARIATAFDMRLRVVRTTEGTWTIFSDHTGEGDFAIEASGEDNIHQYGEWFGVACVFTITNASRFYFDDFAIRTSVPPDRTPPTIDTVHTLTRHSLRVIFSEPVDRSSAENASHYTFREILDRPSSAGISASGSAVDLLFAADLPNGDTLTMLVTGVADTSGNTIASPSHRFFVFAPGDVNFRDVIISEIFADPEPIVGLPSAEYVELYNRGGEPVQLEDWRLSDGSVTATLKDHILFPGDYLVLCSEAAAEAFDAFRTVMPASPFPTLNNTGDVLTLKDGDLHTVDSLRYDRSWYRDDEKAEGGWSLELIDPDNICADGENWTAAPSVSGGTPGAKNSAYANKPDQLGPRLLSILTRGADSLHINFDEKLEDVLPGAAAFVITPSIEVAGVAFSDGSLRSLILALKSPVVPGKRYTLQVRDLYDCAGNRIRENAREGSFLLPQAGAVGDLVISEVLFNPRPSGVDFIELYNTSDKTIDLQGWSTKNPDAGTGSKRAVLSGDDLLIEPHAWMVLTEDPVALKTEYVHAREEAFRLTDVPSLNDDAGSVVLLDDKGVVMDSMRYREELHSAFLRDVEGISLERISYTAAESSSNWRSASSLSGFATPGYRNSNLREGLHPANGWISIDPEIIQPDFAGRDFARISYRLPRGGWMANVRILDPKGRTVKNVAENQLLGTEGFFRWDGVTESGALAATGYYLVFFEIYDASGAVKYFNSRVAVY